jgi:COP9 signalosome complex subunit 5
MKTTSSSKKKCFFFLKKNPNKPTQMSDQAFAELLKWEAANGVIVTDEFNNIDRDKEEELRNKKKPWKEDPTYFKKAFISALALIKIAMHAKTGHGQQGVLSQGDGNNWIEVMGMFAGHVVPHAFVIRDSFALPGVASETSVSITEEGMMYLIQWKMSAKDAGRNDYPVGWYHSHPGLGLFLSGADVKAEELCQMAYEPFVALVIDPVRTISTGKVHIKAFRTYPENYTPQGGMRSDDADVSAKYVKELGVYASRFYEVPLVVYKTSRDEAQLKLLWQNYWVQLLSSSPLTTTRGFLDERLKQLNSKLKMASKNTHQLVNRRNAGNSRNNSGQESVNQVSTAAERASSQMLMGALGIAVKSQCL